MTYLCLSISILVTLLMCQPFLAMSETIEGSIRTDVFSSSRSLDEQTDLVDVSLQLKASPQWDSIKDYGEAWFRADDLFGGNNYRGYLREAYLGWDGADGSIRLGRQRIIWGRADQVNPTDNLTPRDYTLRVPETDDQRQGAYAMKGDYFWRDLTITGIAIPVFKPSNIPLGFPAVIRAGEEITDTNLK
ncbi:MAG: hypothetical protein HY265_04775 [Deltaproteobacteria bacterium]|nr:hypothetical protein [Deltaproteobacteria bacterium]